jgi:prepilin-type N-terminal cleavage/methylation domain-containing protein
MRHHPRGFTLIELLVVITIIVVLLALLAPAMDKAMYATELTACGANFKAVGGGLLSYAMGNQRLYPYRPTTTQPPGSVEQGRYVFNIVHPDPAQGTGRDDRPYLRQHMNMKHLLDPLGGQLDLESPPNSGGNWVMANYTLWYGVAFNPLLGGGRRVQRVGDRLTWTDASRGQTRKVRSAILASDTDVMYTNPTVLTSHPEREAKLMTFYKLQQGTDLHTVQTFSWWWSQFSARSDRNPVDLNYAWADGSVLRLDGVGMFEEEMVRVPLINGGGETFEDSTLFWQQLPPR